MNENTKWILRKDFRFEASHQLMNHDGKCARLHGHSWILTVEVAGDRIQNEELHIIEKFEPQGISIMPDGGFSVAGIASKITDKPNPKGNMLMDYSDISAIVKPFVESHLDHWHLNDTFHSDMPTSEYLASQIFEWFRPKIKGLSAIEISETCTSFCRFERSEKERSLSMFDPGFSRSMPGADELKKS